MDYLLSEDFETDAEVMFMQNKSVVMVLTEHKVNTNFLNIWKMQMRVLKDMPIQMGKLTESN